MNAWHEVHWGMDAYPITLGMTTDSICTGSETFFSDCFLDESFSDEWS